MHSAVQVGRGGVGCGARRPGAGVSLRQQLYLTGIGGVVVQGIEEMVFAVC